MNVLLENEIGIFCFGLWFMFLCKVYVGFFRMLCNRRFLVVE